MAANQKLSRLEALPNELLRDIISRVARFSRRDVCHAMQSSPEVAHHAQDNQVYKSLNLKPFVNNPLWALNNYEQLMERCLSSGNEEAHYVKGILEYFEHNNTNLGLYDLKTSAGGSYENGIYLYGILMLCRSEIDEGKAYLEKLQWEKNKRRADLCWRSIKRSLQGIPVIRKRCYRNTLRNNKPPPECHLNDMDIVSHFKDSVL